MASASSVEYELALAKKVPALARPWCADIVGIDVASRQGIEASFQFVQLPIPEPTFVEDIAPLRKHRLFDLLHDFERLGLLEAECFGVAQQILHGTARVIADQQDMMAHLIRFQGRNDVISRRQIEVAILFLHQTMIQIVIIRVPDCAVEDHAPEDLGSL